MVINKAVHKLNLIKLMGVVSCSLIISFMVMICLRNIWKFNVYNLKTKVRLFNSNVISVLLYGCPSWRVNKNDMHKQDVFQTKCIRRICNIYWPNNISQFYTFSTNKLPDPETQNEMIEPCLENVTRSHTEGITEMDTHRKKIKGSSQDYVEKIYYSRTVRYGSDYAGS